MHSEYDEVVSRLGISDRLYKTWAEIDLGKVKRNLLGIRRRVGEGVKILSVVKSDAYGHGMVAISGAVLEAGADWLGVSNVYEAVILRDAFPGARILILSAGMAGHARTIVERGLTPVICSGEMLDAVAAEAMKAGKVHDIHIMIDTGMGRIGVWHENALAFIRKAAGTEGVRVEGLCSHFSSSFMADQVFSRGQLDAFCNIVRLLEEEGIAVPIRHMANSGGILNVPEAYFNMVRTGILLYGVLPTRYIKEEIGLEPVLTLKTEVCYLKRVGPGRSISYGRIYTTERDTLIATVPIGYGDGYKRPLSNRGEVLVRGRRAPVIGRVTMDQIMVDVTRVPGVSVGDEVVVIGQQGDDEITVDEIAGLVGTIPYDLLCSLGKQVQHRIFK